MTKSRNMRCTNARRAAIASGEKRYRTGIACKNGHIAERQTSNGQCLECAAEKKAERDRAYYIKNAAKIRARSKKWRQDNPDRSRENDRRKWFARHEENLARCRDRYERHREEDIQRKREHYRANAEAERQKTRRRYRENPQPWAVGARNRKARLRNAEGRHTAADIERIFRDQKERCAWCRTCIKGGYHVDHIRPISRGGSNWPSNLQLLCEPCNLRKRAHDPIDFARQEGRLL